MRTMPDPPRTEGLTHEVAVIALQRYLWAAIASGWYPANPSGGGMWTHEDNMAAMQRGWMISQPPGSEHLDLFSLMQGVKPAEVMSGLTKLAHLDELAAKAVTVLAAQRMRNPQIKFAFL